MFDPRGTRHYSDTRLEKWADCLAMGEDLLSGDTQWYQEKLAAMDPAAASMVIYTSGTTGESLKAR